jgi:hypothetical protein
MKLKIWISREIRNSLVIELVIEVVIEVVIVVVLVVHTRQPHFF